MRQPHMPGGRVLSPILLLALALPAPARALTLEEAISLALSRNERSRAAEETARAAEARVGRARSFLFPDLLVSGDYSRSEASGSARNSDGLEARASVNQILFDAQAWPLLTATKRARDAAEADAVESKRTLAYETAARFLAVLTREQVVRSAEERFTLARRNLDEVRVRFGAQLVGSNDVTRADLEVANAERELVNARGNSRTARLGLGYLLDAEVQDSLAVPRALVDRATRPLEAQEPYSEEAVARRPDVQAERARVAALEATAREPMLRLVPDLNVFGSASTFEENDLWDQDWSWGLGLTWPLFDGGERYADHRERTALANAATLELQNLERGVAVEVETARVNLESEQATLTRAEAAVDAARRNAAEAGELYRQGLVRAFEVVDANVQLFEADVELAGARFALVLAYLGLRQSLGLDPLNPEEMP